MVRAKEAINRPKRVSIMVRGKRTTQLVPALARTAMKASLAPIRAASFGSPVSSRRFTMASRTTMELVTRIPTDMPMARSVGALSVYPARCMKKRPMTTVSGMVMETTRRARRL